MKLRNRILTVVFILIILTSFMVVRFFVAQGEFQTIAPQSELTCQPFRAPNGSEDLAADFKNNLVYVSAQNRDSLKRPLEQGGIYRIDLNQEKFEFANLTQNFKGKLHPLGIDLIEHEGKQLLYVINKIEQDSSNVEMFEVANGALKHLKTIDKLPANLNSIKAINDQQFYATLDGNNGALMTAFNGILGLTPSKVIFYDGEFLKNAASDFEFANGIATDASMNQFYVTDTLSRDLVIFKRNPETNQLVEEGRIYLNAGGDNIKRNFDDSFLIAGHLKNVTTSMYIAGSEEVAPSAIFEATPPSEGKAGSLKTIYVEDGSDIPAASVAIKFKDQILVGSIKSDRMLTCKKK